MRESFHMLKNKCCAVVCTKKAVVNYFGGIDKRSETKYDSPKKIIYMLGIVDVIYSHAEQAINTGINLSC